MLTDMLMSVVAQTQKIKTLVSLSFDPSASAKDIGLALRPVLDMDSSDFLIGIHPEPRSQFQHYAALARMLVQDRSPEELWNTWIIFSDDDDLWSPNRAEFFRHFIRSAEHTEPEQFKTMPVIECPHSASSPEGDVGAKTPADVDRRIRAHIDTIHKSPQLEYVELCVRLPVLLNFCDTAHPDLLANTLADCAFYRYARTPLGEITFQAQMEDRDGDDWIYYYRHGSPDSAANARTDKLKRDPRLQRAVQHELSRAGWRHSSHDLWQLISASELVILQHYRLWTVGDASGKMLRAIERKFLYCGIPAREICLTVRPMYPCLARILACEYFAGLWWDGPVTPHVPSL